MKKRLLILFTIFIVTFLCILTACNSDSNSSSINSDTQSQAESLGDSQANNVTNNNDVENDVGPYCFKTSALEKYVIVYSSEHSGYSYLATKLKTQISKAYGKSLSVKLDSRQDASRYEILIGETNRYNHQSGVMEYSVTVDEGRLIINVGGLYSAEQAVDFLCQNLFNGDDITLENGEYYKTSLLSTYKSITAESDVRIMSANLLADSFADSSYKKADYRAEIFAGMLVSCTPDVIGMQEIDSSWSKAIDGYLARIKSVYGISYSKHLDKYQSKTNYTSFLYRSDKFKVENSGVKVFSWWQDASFNHKYHMRNIGWARFSSLTDSDMRFIAANTHWSYRTEYSSGNRYLSGSDTPIAVNELRIQCKDETNAFLTSLRQANPDTPIFLTGDFNTSLPFFTQSDWTPEAFSVLSEESKKNNTAVSVVPESGHFDHIFGAGSYSILKYEFFNDINQHALLSDHPFVYVDLKLV